MNDTVNTVVDTSPVLTYILESLAALLAIAATWGISKIAKLTGIRQEQVQADNIRMALHSGLLLALSENKERIRRAGLINVKSEIVARAGKYVIDSYPDAAKKFGIERPEDLADMIWSRVVAEAESDWPENRPQTPAPAVT